MESESKTQAPLGAFTAGDTEQKPSLKSITVFLSFSGSGGVEHIIMNLVREFARRGVAVDLVLIRARGPHLKDIPEGVRVVQLNAAHTSSAIPELARYLRRVRPERMLVAKDRAGRAAVIARSLSKVDVSICLRLGTNLSEALSYKSAFNRWSRLANMRRIYAKVDRVIGISQGVVDDIRKITGVPAERCRVICNPVVDESLILKSKQPLAHPWYQTGSRPLVVGAGRLTQQKDFATLIRAFAKLREELDAHLVIIGEGRKRRELEQLVAELKIQDYVDMPGFQANPYNWIGQADLFVLSSRWEGSGNVLTEALALGVPSVATDCPSGPSETLAGGKYGALVPVGDYRALANQMAQTLRKPLNAEILRSAVKEYEVGFSAERYLNVVAGIE
jgi:glycosyltransferase involved in cell wall biosynthesis